VSEPATDARYQFVPSSDIFRRAKPARLTIVILTQSTKHIFSELEKTKEGHRSEVSSRPFPPILELHRFQSVNHVVHTSKRYRSICNLPLQLGQRNLWLLDECGGDLHASVAGLPDGPSILLFRVLIG
jgi:hypothetical protein